MQVVIRWGDPVVAGAPAFDPANQTAAAQEKQFGYNNDYLGLYPLPARQQRRRPLPAGRQPRIRQLQPDVRRPGRRPRRQPQDVAGAGRDRDGRASAARWSRSRARTARWKVVDGSKYARRISANTPMRHLRPGGGPRPAQDDRPIRRAARCSAPSPTAPAAARRGAPGSPARRISTSISAATARSCRIPRLHKRYGVGRLGLSAGSRMSIASTSPRSRTSPTASAGWSRSIPTSPQRAPVKRTALGRFKHEGCTYALAKDGRVVFYSGDDERFEYVYKFVTARPWNPNDRAANKNLLDEGTLSVARFNADGKVDVAAAGPGPGSADGRRTALPARPTCCSKTRLRRRSLEAPRRWTGRRTSRPIR